MTRPAVPLILMYNDITDAMLTSSSIAEPATGETAWVSGGTYAIGDERIRTTTHRRYKAITAHTGITTLPENDPINWFDDGPTVRWAAFDAHDSTESEAVTSLSYVIEPGFANAVCVSGAAGETISVVVKDKTGGTVVKSYSAELVGPFYSLADWYWGAPRAQTTHIVTDILTFPDAEVTITITADTGDPVRAGSIRIGNFVPLIVSDGNWGGSEYGAQAKPVNFDFVDIARDGSWKVRAGRKATDINLTAVLPQADADYAIGVVRSINGPTFITGCTAPGYISLSGFGIVKAAPLTYEGKNHARISIDLQGLP